MKVIVCKVLKKKQGPDLSYLSDTRQVLLAKKGLKTGLSKMFWFKKEISTRFFFSLKQFISMTCFIFLVEELEPFFFLLGRKINTVYFFFKKKESPFTEITDRQEEGGGEKRDERSTLFSSKS